MIKISKKADYAIVALSHLVYSGEPVSAKKIAEFYHFPSPMVSKVMKELAQGNIIEGTRGVNGGYKLNMRPDQITLGYILDIMDGPSEITECCSDVNICPASKECLVKYGLNKVQRKIRMLFDNTTLKELINQKNIGEL
ncbi:hypothetical protein CHS0354_035353 [Potamilus streckersoni]|uniref:Rrf2 family transcriptional regulator n=1 Tax=Potamilus streckersoni TaxID=2493646 RepID=A0AAE0S2M7_9BIVA|nr:hypothetical protein CHS0354_035353 [Potamilus streckersoni]